MPSFPTKLTYALLRISNFKTWYVERIVKNAPRSNAKNKVPRILRRGISVEKHQTNGLVTSTIIPDKLSTDQHIIYYHGGHYINEIELSMYQFVIKLAKKAGVKISITDYPLAPESTYLQTHEWAQKNYYQLIKHYGGTTYLMGDSAGGGLALGLAQNLKRQQIPIHHQKILLLCPWIDMQQNYLTAEDEKKCLLLKRKVTEIAQERYSGGADLSHFLLSPIYGELKDIGELVVWYGTEELLSKSVEKLRQIALKKDILIKFYKGEQQHHEYFLLPFREQNEVIEQIRFELNN